MLSAFCAMILIKLAVGRHNSECYAADGQPQQCFPEFVNAAFNKTVVATNTCGDPPQPYVLNQLGQIGTALGHVCNQNDPSKRHSASFIVDYDTRGNRTCWQSETMEAEPALGTWNAGPLQVNITIDLGGLYEVTYVKMKFCGPRPRDFVLLRQTLQGDFTPWQYYSGSCRVTYDMSASRRVIGDNTVGCTERFSDIVPLSGGEISFTPGRRSGFTSKEFTTTSAIRLRLDKMNTFGDEVYRDPKVLQSYFYAISDISVGARCACNGHASQCVSDNVGIPSCVCSHHTVGTNCEQCQPSYRDLPWKAATASRPFECKYEGHAEALFNGMGWTIIDS